MLNVVPHTLKEEMGEEELGAVEEAAVGVVVAVAAAVVVGADYQERYLRGFFSKTNWTLF